MKKSFLALAAVSLLAVACKKNDNNNVNTTPSERIVGTWMKTESRTITTTNGIAGPETDNLAAQSPCARDDHYHFLASRVLLQTEGTTKCRPSDPDTVSRGTYAIVENSTQLLLTLPSGSQTDTFNIQEISGNTMRLKNQYTTTAGPNQIVVENRITYTRK